VAQFDPEAYDVRTRLESLGRQRKTGRTKSTPSVTRKPVSDETAEN
jgi:hypothetical protein